MPALYRRRVQQRLSHKARKVGCGKNAHIRSRNAAAQPHSACDQLCRALHSRILSLLEEVGVEQHAQHVANLMVAIEIRLRQHIYRVRVARRGVRPLRHRLLVRNEEVVQVAGNEARRRRLAADDSHYVIAVEVARLTEEVLLAVVVVPIAEVEMPRDSAVRPDGVLGRAHRHVLRVAQRPARERA